MSSGFDDRGKAFESKWAHDEELRFKVMARRNMMLGRWAATEMGLKGDAIEAYGKAVVQADFEEAGDDDVFRKVRGDFDTAKVDHSDHLIRRKMEELLAEAAQQIMSENGKK
ncbi:MAG TPA: DUF1476 domain-containing protein [Rhizomicrobium sp.]|jgi:hypothetical protein|nr:DUF1476 domain-containing protein [Rhizomicrobium sp.]